MVGRLHGIIVDCPDPRALASFYEGLLGMVRVQESDDFVVIGDSADRPGVAFQRIADYRAPQWPDPAQPPRVHFDIRVEDIEQAERQALELGARPLPGGGEHFRVYADPLGHPFCLVWW